MYVYPLISLKGPKAVDNSSTYFEQPEREIYWPHLSKRLTDSPPRSAFESADSLFLERLVLAQSANSRCLKANKLCRV